MLLSRVAHVYNPARVSFLNGTEWVHDVLNIGIDPVFLLETLKQGFLGAGGCLFENTAFEGARQGKKPDGVCLVVGSCAQGFPKNDSGDLLVSFTPLQNQCQYFWEAFPTRDGRTTYLFTYMDAHPERFGLEALFEDYLRLMPEYHGVELSQLKLQRALFGFFPSYRHPLRTP